jgi:hypothetical protein
MTWQKRTLLGIGLAIVVVGATSTAHAQYGAPPPYAPPPGYAGYPPPPPPPPPRMGVYRTGLFLGGSLGLGAITAADTCGDVCGFAGGLELHLGFMVAPRLALVGDLWFNSHGIAYSSASTTHTLYVAALQYWATDKFWLKGGIGGANMNISDDYNGFTYDDANGWGIMAAGGYEFAQINNVAFDAQLRFGHGFYSPWGDVNSWAVMIGVSWY